MEEINVGIVILYGRYSWDICGNCGISRISGNNPWD